jgi:hypothetical protein
MKRSVKARPTVRGWPVRIGCVPRIQTLRSPFFSNSVVSVAVVTLDNAAIVVRGRSMRSPLSIVGTLAQFAGDELVDVAPHPRFARLDRADQRMLGATEMMRGVLVLGRIAAADVTAFEA